MVCGKATRALTNLCPGCFEYVPVDPLIHVIKVLAPKYPLPFPERLKGERVRCEENPELFFSQKTDERIAAQNICSTCPLKDWCAEFAILNKEVGTWGGTTGKERRDIRRARKLEEVA